MNTEANAPFKDDAAVVGNSVAAPSMTEPQPSAAPSQNSEELVEADTVGIKASELEDLRAEAAKAKEHWEKLVRTAADFDNYKKRAARERQDAVKYANESLVEKLIPVMDTFEMAMTAANSAQAGEMQSLQAGVNMIYQQLKRVLVEAGIEEIDASAQPFNPNLHEAVSQQETAEVPEGRVVQQLRKGYKLRDRLVRPASVVVAKAPAS